MNLRWILGGGLFLLPFFVNAWTTDFYAMLEPPKLYAAFLLGNLAFAILLSRSVHYSLGLLHFIFASSVLITGFGAVQLYPFAYWMAAVSIAILFLKESRENQIFYFKCISVSGAVAATYALFQSQGIDPIFTYAPGVDNTHPISFMGQTTKFGAYIACVAAISLAIRSYIPFLLCSLAAVLTSSSFTLLALGAGVITALRYKPLFRSYFKPIMRVVFLSTIPVLLFAFKYFGDLTLLNPQGRFRVWSTALEAWINGPVLTGFGPGAFQVIYSKNFQPKDLDYGEFIQAHNDYVQFAFDFGLVGIVGASFALFFLIQKAYTLWWNHKWFKEEDVVLSASFAGLFSLMANAIGNFPFQLSPHYVFGVIFLAVILSYKEGKI